MADFVRGSIERITYFNSETGYAVVQVVPDRQNDLVTVVGTVDSVSIGESLDASGRWVTDPRYGRQFQSDQIRVSHPTSAAGIQRYLASGAIRSIGPALAERIVTMFGDMTLQVMSDHTDMLLDVRGIGRARLRKIRCSWQEQQQMRNLMLFLGELGAGSARLAMRIRRVYEDRAIAIIKENPFRLADDVRGIGFKTADQMAQQLGIALDAPARVQAAIKYALRELGGEGHCGYPEQGLIDKVCELVALEPPQVQQALEAEVRERSVVRQAIEHEPWVFLASMYWAEVQVAQQLLRLAQAEHPLPELNMDKALEWVQQKLRIELATAQRQAIATACRSPVMVITGGPGVGKTTLIRSLIEIFIAKGRRAVLAAPTGRAAKRLAESTGRPAKTIHRLLEFDPKTGDFLRNDQQPLKGDLFVLDEFSMVDLQLAGQYLRAVPPGACLVLVGDIDQLPSVGPGRVLADIIDSNCLPTVRLVQVFRQAEASRIVTAAREINAGRIPELTSGENLRDFYFIELDEPEAIQDAIVRLVRDRIPRRFQFEPLRDIQVLAPMKRSTLGTRQLNTLLQSVLNPPEGGPQVERFGIQMRIGDRVIQTRNNYRLNVFNGDTGIITTINRVEQEVQVQYPDQEVKYTFSDLDEIELAYVLSIHKSQGSEYPCVVIPLHTQHYMMLQRNLLYTAVTRGKQLVVIVGSRRALQLAVRRQDTRRRYTALPARLQRLVAGQSPL